MFRPYNCSAVGGKPHHVEVLLKRRQLVCRPVDSSQARPQPAATKPTAAEPAAASVAAAAKSASAKAPTSIAAATAPGTPRCAYAGQTWRYWAQFTYRRLSYPPRSPPYPPGAP